MKVSATGWRLTDKPRTAAIGLIVRRIFRAAFVRSFRTGAARHRPGHWKHARSWALSATWLLERSWGKSLPCLGCCDGLRLNGSVCSQLAVCRISDFGPYNQPACAAKNRLLCVCPWERAVPARAEHWIRPACQQQKQAATTTIASPC
jgi:hypothetical protein